jgi:hypothetical protein
MVKLLCKMLILSFLKIPLYSKINIIIKNNYNKMIVKK